MSEAFTPRQALVRFVIVTAYMAVWYVGFYVGMVNLLHIPSKGAISLLAVGFLLQSVVAAWALAMRVARRDDAQIEERPLRVSSVLGILLAAGLVLAGSIALLEGRIWTAVALVLAGGAATYRALLSRRSKDEDVKVGWRGHSE